MASTKPTKLVSNLLQINLNKSYIASDDLFKDIKSPDIVLIQEPPLRNNRIARVPKTHFQFVPHTTDRARVAILLPRDLAKSAMSLASLNTKDSIVLRISVTNQLTILLASIYMESSDPIPDNLIRRISEHADKEKLPLIICTDSNAHHTTWGHRNCNTRGRQLLLLLGSSGLHVSNTGNTPTFQGHLGSSFIDLTLCNTSALPLISSWKVIQGRSASDH